MDISADIQRQQECVCAEIKGRLEMLEKCYSIIIKFARTLDSTRRKEICQSSEPEVASKISTSAQEPSSHGIYCPVCFVSLSQVKKANHQMHSTTCGHIFCGLCITKISVATKQCPTCRKILNISNIHPIFI